MSHRTTYNEQRFLGEEGALNYATGGSESSPMLFLHGVTRCWQDMEPLMSAFGGERRVFGLDFRGHGLSEKCDSYRVADYIRDVKAFINSQFEAPCVLFGHSLGAMVAAGVAAEAPHQITALILEDPPFDTMGADIRKTSFYAYFAALNSLVAEKCESSEEREWRLANLRFPSPDGKALVRMGDVRSEEAIRFHAECLSRLDPETLSPILAERWLEGWDWEAALRRISCPALLLTGDFNFGGMLPEEVADKAAKAISGCERVEFKGAGHQLHATQLDRVLESAKAFLKRVEETPQRGGF